MNKNNLKKHIQNKTKQKQKGEKKESQSERKKGHTPKSPPFPRIIFTYSLPISSSKSLESNVFTFAYLFC